MFTTSSPILGCERNHYFVKIMLFLLMQIMYLVYIHTEHPHDDSSFNTLELVNEYAFLALGYVMLLFTGLGDRTDEM